MYQSVFPKEGKKVDWTFFFKGEQYGVEVPTDEEFSSSYWNERKR